jgi:hypothetical protein
MRAAALALALLAAMPLRAQEETEPASPPPRAVEGLSVAFDAGYSDLSGARNSAQAVFGSSGGGAFGASVRKPFGSDFFVELAGRVFRKQGERAFVADRTATAFRLGHPLELRLIPIQATFAYRHGRVIGLDTYVGLGGGVVLYEETSTVAGVAEPTLSRTSGSAHVVLGADRWYGRMRVGVAVAFAVAPSTLGAGGVSKVYEEEDVGGFTGLVRIGFGGGRKAQPPEPMPEPELQQP